MNKKLLALAVVAAMPVAALADGPTVYGKLNVSLDKAKFDTGVAATTTNNWALNSNASRIGVRGEVDTNIADLKGIYTAEFGVKADDGAATAAFPAPPAVPTSPATPFSQRNIYVGVKGGFGKVVTGKIDSPLKSAQGNFDQFNDLAGDIANLMIGEDRPSNVVAYASPKIADAVTITVALIPGEGADIDADGQPDKGLADAKSVSVVYSADAFYGALAINKKVPFAAAGNVDGFTSPAADSTRLVLGYKADAFEAGLLYQKADDLAAGSSKSDKAIALSGAFISGDWKFKAQVGNDKGSVSGTKRSETALGVDYTLGKTTMTYLTLATVKNDVTAAVGDTKMTTLSLGLAQTF